MKLLALVALALTSTGCVAVIENLDPKPTVNLPETQTPLILYVDEVVKQEFRAGGPGNVEFRTWRSDLAAGFKAGFKDSFKTGATGGLALRVMDTDVSFNCYAYVGCQAQLKFKAMLSKDIPGATGQRFAGRVQTEVCQQSLEQCGRQAVEMLYEEIAKQLVQAVREGGSLNPGPTTPTVKPGDAT